MKVLYYNWTPINGQGGGVAIYMRNLLEYLGKNKEELGIEPYFLSSGYYYEKRKDRKLYVKQENDFFGVPIFCMVNSPVISPAANAVNSFYEIMTDTAQLRILRNFIDHIGGVDIIHFNSFEGLSFNVLKIKKYYPDIKIVHSVHDYGSMCPRVRFWNYRQENCLKSKMRDKCVGCLKGCKYGLTEDNILARIISLSGIEVPYDDISKDIRPVRIIKRIISRMLFSMMYSNNRYKEHNVSMINKFTDLEIGVSRRVADILVENGVNKNKVIVDYIGTYIAENSLCKCRTKSDTELFTILYMGYANEDKGFYSFLSALQSIKRNVSDKIVVKIASKMSYKARTKTDQIKDLYNNLVVYNGYSHDDFSEIMRDVNLGIVPPLWEDNFPQVAIEMVANGIPVITSMNGGAHELNDNNNFRFESSSELTEKIENIFHHRNLLDEYWNTTMKLTTFKMHVANLLSIYKSLQ